MHSDLQEREAMRRKLLVLFVAFASVFGVMACGGAVEVEEESEEAKQEEREAQEEEREAEEELKEAEQATEEEEQQEEDLKK